MSRNEKSGKHAASVAGKVLADPKATKAEKTLAGSVLTQAPDRKKKRMKVKPNAKRTKR